MPDRRLSEPLAGSNLLGGGAHDGRYSEPVLRQALRTCVATLLVQATLSLSAPTTARCGFAAASNAPSQSALTEMTLTPHVLAENIHTDVRAIGHPAYPLKTSANNRYLVDQNNAPFLMVGDSPQALIGNLSPMEAALFMENRRGYGINALWINLLCNGGTACNADGTTFDGIAPFTTASDLSTPNPAYFERADVIINLAAANGMVVILDPIETTGWLPTLRANGIDKAFAYGRYVGNRYENFSNIIWMHGNDFQSWQNAADDALVQAVALGIRSVKSNHIHTVALNFFTSGSLEDQSWAPLIELNAAYTYFPTYAQVLTEYNRSNFKPVFMVEANYEFEHNPCTDGGSTQNLRRQEYWTMLSGATGQLYGSAYTWQLQKGRDLNLDTPGVIQLSYMKNLFVGKKWHDLIPDQNHAVVTAGYNSCSCLIGKLSAHGGKDCDFMAKLKYLAIGSITSNSCATAARTSDGYLVIAYMPTIRTITVDMSKLSAIATARWYDPTSGEYRDINGSPFANTGSRQFTPPGNNSSGDGDWVLVIEASTAR
jgi:uncharacterized protein DUF4038/collagenase-like protein with putative collagen-binding domain